MAGKLCYQAGIVDVEEWMTQPNVSRVLNFWEAFDRVNPLPDPWQQSATICQQISLLVSVLMRREGAEVEPDSWEAFMPPRWKPPPVRPKIKSMTPEQLAKNLDSALKVK